MATRQGRYQPVPASGNATRNRSTAAEAVEPVLTDAHPSTPFTPHGIQDVPFPAARRPLDTASVLALQRTHGNAHVQRLLRQRAADAPADGNQPELASLRRAAGGSRSVGEAIQREGEVKADAAPAAPATAPGAGGAADTTKDKGKTANLTLTAIYENVPGKAKNKVKRADRDDALWFAPLTMFSNYPEREEQTQSLGITAGGQTTVDKFPAPITEGDNPVGRGSISAQLQYASQKNKSFDVQVSGVKQEHKATQEARKFIERKMEVYGDVDQIAKQAEAELASAYPGAKVSITMRPNKVMDAGQSTFYYKIRNDAGILMNVQVVPVGEKQTEYSGSKTGGKASEDETTKRTASETEKVDVKKDVKDTERRTEKSQESVEVDYNEAVVRTLEDYVSKARTVHNQVASDLAVTVVKDEEYHKDDVWAEKRSALEVEDYTKKVEGGQKDKENWAAIAKKVIKGAKILKRLPGIDMIPIVGPLTRKVRGFWLDTAGWLADRFAETGQVNYVDTKIDKKTTIQDDTAGRNDVDITRHDEEETKRKIAEDYKSTTKDDWERHLKDVTTIAKKYKSLTKKESVGTTDKTHSEDYSKTTKKDESEATERHKDTEHKTTTTTFRVSQTWKYTAPVVKATVVRGDAEVHNVPFPPEADEKKAVKK